MMVKVSRGEEVEWFGVLEGFSLSACHIAQGVRNKKFLQTRVSNDPRTRTQGKMFNNRPRLKGNSGLINT